MKLQGSESVLHWNRLRRILTASNPDSWPLLRDKKGENGGEGRGMKMEKGLKKRGRLSPRGDDRLDCPY